MDTEPDYSSDADAYVVAPEKDKRGIPRYSRRQQLAVLATHPENHAFNRNLANRLWAAMMGQGLVHPVDMHHSENPPASAALLQRLADELVATRYDLRSFLRQIARSHAWQRSVLVPDLQHWQGPSGGTAALKDALAAIDAQQAPLQPALAQLNQELSTATEHLQRTQADVGRLQSQLDDARKRLQETIEQRDRDTAKLTETKEALAKHRQLVESLKAAQNEAELAAANQLNEKLDQQVDELEEMVENHGQKTEGLRSRTLALANRKLALAEFVVEARGIHRGIRKRILDQLDLQADLHQQRSRIGLLLSWLEHRSLIQQTEATGGHVSEQLRVEMDQRQAALVESWRQSFALRRIRPLSPEQMSSATYFALEMHRPVTAKAIAEWQSKNQDNTADRDDAVKRQEFVTTAVAVNLWDTVEDLVVTRFAAPAGAPQDSFFATVDQALMIQNDVTFQGWLKASEGNLIERLGSSGTGTTGVTALSGNSLQVAGRRRNKHGPRTAHTGIRGSFCDDSGACLGAAGVFRVSLFDVISAWNR
jgi:predicted nuclease with TOPRIM domain